MYVACSLSTLSGEAVPILHSTLLLGIALLKEGNQQVQDVSDHFVVGNHHNTLEGKLHDLIILKIELREKKILHNDFLFNQT